MQLFLGATIFSFLITSVLIVPVIGVLYRLKFTRRSEVEEVRKGRTAELDAIRAKHARKAGTPTGLGLLLAAITAGLFVALLPFLEWIGPQANLVSGYPLRAEVAVIVITFVGFGCLGLYDDLMKIFGFSRTGFFGLKRWHKFVLQWVVAAVSAASLYYWLHIDIIYVPFWGVVQLGWWYLPLAAFLMVTFANAFDITSGLDALGEGLLLICLLGFWVIAAAQLDRVLSLFLSVWIGALIAGIYFTIHPARAFLGNASGMAFGATLALVGLLSGKMIALVIMGGMFLVDGGSSLVQIISKNLFGKRIFPIAPLHHWLEIRGWEEPKIVARAWLAGLMLALFGVWLAFL